MADLLGIERLSEGNAFGVVCPFCGDRRGKMNFRIFKDGEPANTYHCFKCGASGNMLTLYADVKGLYCADRYRQAYREIKEAVRGGIHPVPMASSHNVISCKESALAEPQKLDQVYRRLQELLPLSDFHRQKLLERGLTDEQISSYGFCSTPVSGTEGLARKLIREGYSLKGVPGFFLNAHGNWDASFFRKNRGFLCPVYGLDQNLSGFQIRLDEPYNDRKYLWFSSSNRNLGTSSKSPVTFLGAPASKIVCVTEGILKATIAHAMSGYSFLGTPGVSQYKEMERTLRILKGNGLEEVWEYFDMDKLMDVSCRNDYKEPVCHTCPQNGQHFLGVCEKKVQKRSQIQEGCRHLYEICNRLDLRCVRKIWDFDENHIWKGDLKGIDDYWLYCQRKRKEERENEFFRAAAAGSSIPPCT